MARAVTMVVGVLSLVVALASVSAGPAEPRDAQRILRELAALRGYRGPLPTPSFRRPDDPVVATARMSRGRTAPHQQPALQRLLRLPVYPGETGNESWNTAFYMPEYDMIVLAGDETTKTVAHELAHALQRKMLAEVSSPSELLDRRLAERAFVEGDATVLALSYTIGRRWSDEWKRQGRRMKHQADKEGPFWQIFGTAPYLSGVAFASQLLKRSGWRGLNRAFARPPVSTEQILHVDKYLSAEGPRPLAPLSLPDPYEIVDEDRLGEQAMAAWLRQHQVGEQRVAEATEGWGNDAVRVFRAAADSPEFLAQVSVWDSARDAAEMALVLRDLLRTRFCTGDVEHLNDTLECTDGIESAAGVWRRDTRVVFFLGVPRARLADMRASIRVALAQ